MVLNAVTPSVRTSRFTFVPDHFFSRKKPFVLNISHCVSLAVVFDFSSFLFETTSLRPGSLFRVQTERYELRMHQFSRFHSPFIAIMVLLSLCEFFFPNELSLLVEAILLSLKPSEKKYIFKMYLTSLFFETINILKRVFTLTCDLCKHVLWLLKQ